MVSHEINAECELFVASLGAKLDSLNSAVRAGRSRRWILVLWARYIKARDGGRCVICCASDGLQAHHIIRKSLVPLAAYDVGNGILLCKQCHHSVHEEFNGSPRLDLPVGAQGGDDQDVWAFFFEALCIDADRRALEHDKFYALSDDFLRFTFKCQGFNSFAESVLSAKLSRLRFACESWRRMPLVGGGGILAAIVRANVISHAGKIMGFIGCSQGGSK